MNKRGIPFIDLSFRHSPFAEAFHRDLERVLASGSYILGEEVLAFEKMIKRYTGAKHAIGVGNGTDALILCLKTLGIGQGDEVITTPMSYLASTSAIALSGATAVFVDIDSSLNVDPAKM